MPREKKLQNENNESAIAKIDLQNLLLYERLEQSKHPTRYETLPKWFEEKIAEEIRAAIEAEHNGKKFPPFEHLAYAIQTGRFETLSPDIRTLFSDYISGKHRRSRGEKISSSQQRAIDIARAELFAEMLGKHETIDDAYAELAKNEKMGGKVKEDFGSDISGIRKSVKRGVQYLKDDISELEDKLAKSQATKILMALAKME